MIECDNWYVHPDVRAKVYHAVVSLVKGFCVNSIDRHSPIPKYLQLAQALRSQIRAGAFDASHEIPSERELQQRYRVSRHTVRQAIDLLVTEGLVRREQGRGSYILPEALNVRSRIDTFFEHHETIREFGYTPTVEHISTEQCKPEDPIREALRLEHDEGVVCFTKLFYADGQPAIFAKDFVPEKSIVEPFDDTEAGRRFFDFAEEIVRNRIEYLLSDIIPIAAAGPVARHLQCPEGTPILLLRELFLDISQENPLLFATNYHNPELIRYRILRRRRQV